MTEKWIYFFIQLSFENFMHEYSAYITSIIPSPLKLLHVFPAPSQVHNLFFDYCYICMYAYVYSNTACGVHLVLLICECVQA